MSKFKVLWIDDQTQKCKRDSRSVKKSLKVWDLSRTSSLKMTFPDIV